MAEPSAPEELWEEILLRLPPDDPASLLRASLACKLLRHIVSRRGFLRRLAEHHRAAPMLGVFTSTGTFIPTIAGSAFRLPAPDRRTWRRFLDCRHGRALLLDAPARELLVWEPITGYQQRVPLPAAVVGRWDSSNAAVVCAAGGCDHRSCHGGPFRIVAVWSGGKPEDPYPVVSAWEFSSATGAWGEPTPIPYFYPTRRLHMNLNPSILVGNSLYFLCGTWEIIKYDLGRQGQTAAVVTVMKWARAVVAICVNIGLMQAEDGGLGIAGARNWCLELWSPQMNGDADAGWVLRRTVHLKNLLPSAAIGVIGFVEGENVVFLDTEEDGIFSIELDSGRAMKLCTRMGTCILFPFISFYAPGIRANAEE